MLLAVQISFQKYDLLSPPRWIGLDNYAFLLSNERVLNSFKVTGIFIVAQTVGLRDIQAGRAAEVAEHQGAAAPAGQPREAALRQRAREHLRRLAHVAEQR